MKTFALCFALIVLVALYETSVAADLCDESKGEVYMSCGTACPATCDNYNTIRPCTLQCVQGCFCKRGLVRNADDYCVDPSEC
uniref:U28-Liphistoxin-Lsp1a_1 n=1 Tax=Liphistius sp. SGP-2016 TaxID=1905180 RepID=A0A4V2H9C9_9ARAC